MGRLIYALGMSLDGYVVDTAGGFDWSTPDEEAHRLANEEARDTAAFLFGRRMFEIMEGFWPAAADATTAAHRGGVRPPLRAGPRGRLLRHAGLGTRRRASGAPRGRPRRGGAAQGGIDGHLGLGGAALAASLIDLIDEFRMWVNPVAVGGGTPFFPAVPGVRRLRRLEARALQSGALYLRYERAD